MERRYIPESESKLTILYALRRVGPATAMQLLHFLVDNDLMNYITMQLNLSDMQEQGQLLLQSHPIGDLLTLTQEGEFTLDAFAQRIPVSRRQLMDACAPAWRERFRLEQLTPADSFTLQDGSICLRLRLLEGSASLIDILITLPHQSSLTFLEQRWRTAAQAVYDTVTLTLSADFGAPDPDAVPGDTALIQHTGGSEWLLSLTDQPERPNLTILLPLADENLARHCAARWPGCMDALRRHILQALQDGLET